MMSSLITAETQRLVSRRMTRFFPLGLAALMVLGIVIAILVTDNGPDFVNDIASGYGAGGPDDNSTLVLGPMGFLIPILAFVVGASYFGADQKTGMIEQILTWEPRRARLLVARAVGGVAAMFVITALLSAFLVVLLYILASLTGTVDGAFDIWPMVLGAIVRSGITGSIFFVLGLGVTVLTNNSIASIVGFLIYVFVVEIALLQPLLPKVSVWLPMQNADGFVARNGVGDGGFFSGGPDSFAGNDFHHGWISAGLLLAAWATAAFIAAVLFFNRRDID